MINQAAVNARNACLARINFNSPLQRNYQKMHVLLVYSSEYEVGVRKMAVNGRITLIFHGLTKQ